MDKWMSEMVTIGHMSLFKFEWIKIKASFFRPLAMFEVLNIHMWLEPTALDSTDGEYLNHHRKFCGGDAAPWNMSYW